MKTDALSRVLDGHIKLVDDVSRLHVESRRGMLRMTSANQVGVVYETVDKADFPDFYACVDGTFLRGVLKAAHEDVRLSTTSTTLVVVGQKIKADMPLVSGGDRRSPRLAGGAVKLGRDTEKLCAALKAMKIRDVGADAVLSIVGDGRRVVVSYYDPYHGAITQWDSPVRASVGVFPADLERLNTFLLDNEDVSIVVGDSIGLYASGASLLIPGTSPTAIDPDSITQAEKSVAKFDVAEVRDVVEGMYVVNKEAIIRFEAASSRLVLDSASKAGSIKRAVSARVAQPVKANLSCKKLMHVLRLLDGETTLRAHFDGSGEAVRFHLSSGDTTYMLVTTE